MRDWSAIQDLMFTIGGTYVNLIANRNKLEIVVSKLDGEDIERYLEIDYRILSEVKILTNINNFIENKFITSGIIIDLNLDQMSITIYKDEFNPDIYI